MIFAPLPPFLAEVTGRQRVARDVTELTLTPVDRVRRAWQPGAHIELHLGRGLVRQYSLCGPPHSVDLRIAVLREADGRGGSIVTTDELVVGSKVEVGGPQNRFGLFDARRYHFIAGGIGITPLRSMVERVDQAGREWVLDYGGRSRASMAYADELVSAYGRRVRIHPQDEVGLLRLDELVLPSPGTLVYCCGPDGLLATVETMSKAWPPATLHIERFINAVELSAEQDDAFVVEFSESGVRAEVPPGTSILDVALRAGIDVPYSCREGACGTCEARVLRGEPRHRDAVLSAEDRARGDRMMVCVSGCKSRELVLEL